MNVGEADIQALLAEHCPLYQHIGLVVESARDGIYRCHVPLDASNGNHLGTVHAAIQWAAAEMLGALVVLSAFGPEQLGQLYAAVKSASIEFIRPARTSITAEAFLGLEENERMVGVVAAGGEARFGLLANVRSTSGETLATLRAEYVVRRRRPAAPTG